MNTLIREGKIKEMIIVVPNGDNAYQGSFYTNSSVTGNWEDSVVRDLVSYVDTHYRTIRSAESRGIAGHSMGGYASIVIGMKQPDVFGTVYAMSPCCMIMEADMTADQNPAWKKALGIKDRGKLVKDPETIDDFYVDAIIALPAAFSPNPQKGPLFVDFPYADQAGKLVTKEPGWSEWEQKMPTVIEPEFKDNLKKLHGLWIECGIQDDFPHIPLGVRALPAELTRDGVPHVVAVYTGDHQDHIRERLETSALPFFSRVLKSSDVPDASH
jgi:S-formylglutathione hydrolase FrmB